MSVFIFINFDKSTLDKGLRLGSCLVLVVQTDRNAGGYRSMFYACNLSHVDKIYWLKVVALIVIVLFWPSISIALDTTTPGAISIEPAHESLKVVAPYFDDDNTDSGMTIYWASEGTDWADASVESVVLGNQSSPYKHTIESLQNFQPYQVKVVYSDDDGISNGLQEQVANNLTPFNRLVHNSYTTGSLKWSARGGWGLPDTKYGSFSCETCHERKNGNVKRIRAGVAVTDAGCPDTFPIQDDGGNVIFLSTKPGQSDFGDDEELPTEASDNICEACHTQNKFHNYNSTTNTSGTDHYNQEDCTSCHQHKEGFKPGCGGSHHGALKA